ncbi:hypothetical protein HPB48_016163 [Haemaphysalis longicornis]|uniref:HTH CENPB-type domain-containing protein n=1 Tax=Haemaphysalis longicornis TaxID=44386 RepID=A0A9J6G750_HAELO|nr:hypothetical protein HPB48_016163 [Haemaphysalis longicornis]
MGGFPATPHRQTSLPRRQAAQLNKTARVTEALAKRSPEVQPSSALSSSDRPAETLPVRRDMTAPLPADPQPRRYTVWALGFALGHAGRGSSRTAGAAMWLEMTATAKLCRHRSLSRASSQANRANYVFCGPLNPVTSQRKSAGHINKASHFDRTLQGVRNYRKRLRKPTYADVEDALLKWFVDTRARNTPISGSMMLRKARDFTFMLDFPDFCPHNGWQHRFKWLSEFYRDMQRQGRRVQLVIDNCLCAPRASFLDGPNLSLRVSLYSAVEMVKAAWSEVAAISVRNCFRKAGFADTEREAEPDASDGQSGGNLWQRVIDCDMGGHDLGWDDFVCADKADATVTRVGDPRRRPSISTGARREELRQHPQRISPDEAVRVSYGRTPFMPRGLIVIKGCSWRTYTRGQGSGKCRTAPPAAAFLSERRAGQRKAMAVAKVRAGHDRESIGRGGNWAKRAWKPMQLEERRRGRSCMQACFRACTPSISFGA